MYKWVVWAIVMVGFVGAALWWAPRIETKGQGPLVKLVEEVDTSWRRRRLAKLALWYTLLSLLWENLSQVGP